MLFWLENIKSFSLLFMLLSISTVYYLAVATWYTVPEISQSHFNVECYAIQHNPAMMQTGNTCIKIA